MTENERELIAEARRLIDLGREQIKQADLLLEESKLRSKLLDIELAHAIQRLQTNQVGRHVRA